MAYQRFTLPSRVAGVAGVAEVQRPKDAHAVATVADVATEPTTAWDEEDWKALFDERAGVLEYDAGLDRKEAEKLAREEVALRYPTDSITP